ncbi:MAG: ABC transporter ATP-binding protein [Ruminococcus sp.]|nr:ABC transporter ATP-binding protein [Ruminococcus sp.]
MAPKKKFRLWQEWKNNKGHLAWIIRQGKGFRRYTLGFLLISFVSMIISLVSSVAGKYVVDSATTSGTDYFYKYIFIMLGTTLVTIVLSFFSNLFSSFVGEKFAFSIRAQMFDRVQRSRWYDISKFHSADILSRLTGDVSNLASAIISIVPTAIVALTELIIVAVVLIYYDPVMAVIGLIIGPLGAVAGTAFRRRFVRYRNELRESESEYYSFFQETLLNLPVTKVFQLEDSNKEYFESIRDKRLSLVMKSSRLSALMSVFMRLVYNVGYVVAFSWCAYRLSDPTTGYTYGTMTLFLSLVSILQGTINSLGGIIPQLFSTIVSARRLREITEVPAEEYTPDMDIPHRVGLQINNVSFTYESEKVLDGVSLAVKPSERVGIVGSSGAGKTTLIRLMLSLIEADEGEAFYITDGEKEAISPDSRRFISYVPQGNTLMSGTIRSNLLTADANATDEQMWKALEIACADKFVRRCPMMLDTPLSEKAGGISEGQAQRIAIARAILRNRPVLILDEATSALDEDTESRIFERLTAETDKTCFIITHRRSMLKYCDSVFEIDGNGKAQHKVL